MIEDQKSKVYTLQRKKNNSTKQDHKLLNDNQQTPQKGKYFLFFVVINSLDFIFLPYFFHISSIFLPYLSFFLQLYLFYPIILRNLLQYILVVKFYTLAHLHKISLKHFLAKSNFLMYPNPTPIF